MWNDTCDNPIQGILPRYSRLSFTKGQTIRIGFEEIPLKRAQAILLKPCEVYSLYVPISVCWGFFEVVFLYASRIFRSADFIITLATIIRGLHSVSSTSDEDDFLSYYGRPLNVDTPWREVLPHAPRRDIFLSLVLPSGVLYDLYCICVSFTLGMMSLEVFTFLAKRVSLFVKCVIFLVKWVIRLISLVTLSLVIF